MKLCFQRAAALAVCLALWNSTAVRANNNRQYQMAGATAEAADSMADYNSVESYTECQSTDYTPGHMGWGQSRFVRQGSFVVGGDYLNVRPTFSEANGLIVITDFNPSPPVRQIDYIPIEFDYNSSYRFYGGYRWDECGEEIIFTYTRFQNNSDFDSGEVPDAVPPQAAIIFRDPHQEAPVGPDDRVLQDVDVDIAAYDLAFGKTIPICSCYDPCGGCDSCCDTCCGSGCGSGSGCCCPCPAWDFTWRAGVRFAEVDWQRTGTIDVVAPGNDIVGYTTLDFEGGGPRVGLTGRRYCGQSRILSIYASSDAAILLGNVDMVHSADNGNIVTTMTNTQLFPVLDIEAGGTIQVTNNLSLSAGYLFSAWFDLGMRDTVVPLAANTGAWWDDANILGFDGFFGRAELTF
jgi:hypothetical protein